jgi:DNA-binding PadR family transcriptional regulator
MYSGRRGHRGGHGGGGGFRKSRMLTSGDVQLIVLALLDKNPSHGYEIIKALEEHSYGLYKASPSVVYPALTYLEEMGFAVSEAVANKKLFKITSSGEEHLAKNRELVDDILMELAHAGRKMARVQREIAEEEAESSVEFEGSRAVRYEWRRLKMEFRELREEFREAIKERVDTSVEEQKRLHAILKKAIKEVRGR